MSGSDRSPSHEISVSEHDLRMLAILYDSSPPINTVSQDDYEEQRTAERADSVFDT
jgi:hypothetical protein